MLAIAASALIAGIAASAWALRDHWLREASPAVRGAATAREHGCEACHRAAERSGARGAEGGEAAGAPSLFGGEAAAAAIERGLAGLPHSGGLCAEERATLIAWIGLARHARQVSGPPDAERRALERRSWIARAERLARRECFTCHGELGQGGVRNPGSLKGSVPGFFGRDLDALTQGGDPAVIREWIRDGVPGFFRRFGLLGVRPALWFTARQHTRMPAYGDRLASAEIELLVRYVVLLHELGPLDADALTRYRRRVRDGR